MSESKVDLEKILAAYIADSDRRAAEADKRAAEEKERSAEADRRIEKLERTIKHVGKQLGGIGHNNGHYAEQFFFKALKKSMTFCGAAYDEIWKNVHLSKGQTEDEFDIVLFNGSSVAVVEVKYRIHPNDLERLINRKVEHFRMLFPQYAKHKLYLGIAGMSFDENVTEQAAAAGVAVLERKDREVESTAANLKAY